MNHRGSCHCGRVAFEVEGAPQGVVACNCSICQRKGVLMWFVPRERFHLRTPDADASSYTFNRHAIRHRFCPVCGIHPYAEGTDPSGQPMVAINLRCLEDVDPEAFEVTRYDGRAL